MVSSEEKTKDEDIGFDASKLKCTLVILQCFQADGLGSEIQFWDVKGSYWRCAVQS